MTAKRPRPRLTPDDWIKAGFRHLVAHGPAGLRLDAMARDLGATKGSFYWHFKDMAGLRSAMLGTWEAMATRHIAETVTQSGMNGRGKLELLVTLAARPPGPDIGGPGAEPMIRDWARVDLQAQAVVARVDRQRLDDLTGWFDEAGHAEPAAAARSFYAALIGLEALHLSLGIDVETGLRDVLARLLPPRT